MRRAQGQELVEEEELANEERPEELEGPRSICDKIPGEECVSRRRNWPTISSAAEKPKTRIEDC